MSGSGSTSSDTPLSDVKGTDKISQRVQAAFSGDGKVIEYAPSFLEAVRSSLKQTSGELNRSVIFLFLSIVVFQLIVDAAVTEVSLGPFKLVSMTLMQKALPAIAVYYTLNVMFLVVVRRKTLEVHDSVVDHLYNPISKYDLELYMTPHLGSLVDSYTYTGGKSQNFLYNLAVATIVLLAIAILVFQIYAFYQLFRQFKATDILVWISLLFTTVFLAQTVAIILMRKDW